MALVITCVKAVATHDYLAFCEYLSLPAVFIGISERRSGHTRSVPGHTRSCGIPAPAGRTSISARRPPTFGSVMCILDHHW